MKQLPQVSAIIWPRLGKLNSKNRETEGVSWNYEKQNELLEVFENDTSYHLLTGGALRSV